MNDILFLIEQFEGIESGKNIGNNNLNRNDLIT
jgi:hypothetical protein